jgi:hypothetical protein
VGLRLLVARAGAINDNGQPVLRGGQALHSLFGREEFNFDFWRGFFSHFNLGLKSSWVIGDPLMRLEEERARAINQLSWLMVSG